MGSSWEVVANGFDSCGSGWWWRLSSVDGVTELRKLVKMVSFMSRHFTMILKGHPTEAQSKEGWSLWCTQWRGVRTGTCEQTR